MTPREHISDDAFAMRLITVAQYILVVVFGLLPIFFIPSPIAPFAYSKVLLVVVGVLLAVIVYGFALLRSGVIRLHFSWAPVILWVVALVALISAVLSGDFRDAFIGEAFEVHTALFVALMALTASIWSVLGTNKTAIMKLFMFLAGSTIVLSVFHVSRLVFGPDMLAFGLFNGERTFSPLGGWNDLAIFFGLAVILSLVALEQLKLTRLGQSIFSLVVLAALVMLGVINFFAVWVVLGLISLAVLIYGLTKDHFSGRASSEAKSHIGMVSIAVSLVVFIAAMVFVLGGSMIGNVISQRTGISYLEVRPSFSATTNIVKQVYENRLLFGSGPNRFNDVWRQYKDPSINESVFWSTDFIAGFGYIPTVFATMGLVGGVAWIAFFIFFVIAGVRMLIKTTVNDRLWYFIGTTSFIGGLYIWAMTVIYVPGPVLMLTAALCTGLMCAAYGALMQDRVVELSTHVNRQMSIVLIVLFLILAIGSGSALYFVGRHYAGITIFNSGAALIVEGVPISEIEKRTLLAYSVSSDDAFARKLAEYEIARMGALMGIEKPTDEQKKEFNEALAGAIQAAQTAVAGDATDPRNVNVLGNVYMGLVPANIEGAYDRAAENLTKARDLDPKNPLHLLGLGRLAFAVGKTDEARAYVAQAIAMKSNYTDAMFFLAQMDIAAGDTTAAIERTRAITVFEPQNPVRYFQLGVLLFSTQKHAEAAAALERAVALNKDYANARFYLALAYDALGRSADARAQLNEILVLNPGNELILTLITRLDRKEPLIAPPAVEPLVPESPVVKDEEGSVTSSDAPDTPLVTPVNTPNEEVLEAEGGQ